MRLDAKKLLTFYRRPVSQRVRDIGVWYRILDSIGKLSVITNVGNKTSVPFLIHSRILNVTFITNKSLFVQGCIIAFTSNFIPRLVYTYAVSEDHTLNGFLNHSLAYFDVRDLEKGAAPNKSDFNVTVCR